MDPALISALLNAPKLANAVASFLGLADSIERKAQTLCSTPFNSALRFLRTAHSSETQREHLLREAQRSFTDALTLESGSRLATAYLGLAMCQSYLGDPSNAMATLHELGEHPFPDPRKHVEAAKAAFRESKSMVSPIGALFFPFNLLTALVPNQVADKLIDRIARLDDSGAALELQAMAGTYAHESGRRP